MPPPPNPQLVAEAGSPKDRRAASRIYPIRKRGNLLLCTLLLGNVSVNALISILMADITNGAGSGPQCSLTHKLALLWQVRLVVRASAGVSPRRRA
jgi:hypothetical protein